MNTAALLVTMLLTAAAPSPEILKQYHAAAATVGRSSEANLELALWCEEHGLEAERLRHLLLAVVSEPTNATARGLLGFVRDGDRWRRPYAVADRVGSDQELSEKLARYNALRAKTPDTADDQEKLARWCDQHDLKPERTAHLYAVVRLDPSRESAWKKLGYRRHKGRWMTAELIAATTAEAIAQHKADVTWRAKLQDWKRELKSKSKAPAAERGLAEVHDPRAVPAVWKVFVDDPQPDQAHGVQILGQIEGLAATRALAMLAVGSSKQEIRRSAGETLLRRDPRESIGLLVSVLHLPLKYEIRASSGPGQPGELFVEGEKYNVHRHYDAPALPAETVEILKQRMNGYFSVVVPQEAQLLSNSVGLLPNRPMAVAPDVGAQTPQQLRGVPLPLRTLALNSQPTATDLKDLLFLSTAVQGLQSWRDNVIQTNLNEARLAVSSANAQLQRDVADIEALNSRINTRNDAALSVLRPMTGQDFSTDSVRWTAWWTDQQGYAYRSPQTTPKPTFEQVAPTYRPDYRPVHHSCFAAGTSVLTFNGPRPIELIQVGDRVLSQDTTTGALDFRPVLRVFHNPPAPTLSLKLGSDIVVATGIHRFWKAGKGWTMARELKPGDLVRTQDGCSRVEGVADAPTQPVFNLEIADGHSFFVGKAGALAHDNSLVRPVSDPYDARPELAVVEGE